MEPYTIVQTTADLRRAIAERRRQVGLTMLELDDAAGTQSGYAAKLLGPGRMKNFGHMSLAALLGALGMKLVVALEDAPHLLEESEPIGDLALSSLLSVLGLRLTLVADDALTLHRVDGRLDRKIAEAADEANLAA